MTGSSGDGAIDGVRRRDEILQALFWLRGEGLADLVTADDLRRILARPEDAARDGRGAASDTLEIDLGHLEEAGFVSRTPDGRIELTEVGAREGGRRFVDAFSGMTAQAHGECSDPDCDCHTDPEAALECHRERHRVGH